MRLFLLMLAVALVGCGPLKQVRKARKAVNTLERLVREHPELADTLKIVSRDTIKTAPLQADIVHDRVIDSAAVDSLSRELCAKLIAAHQPIHDTVRVVDPKLVRELQAARRRLLQAACPPLALDTAFQVKVFNKTFKTELPIGLSVTTVAGRLQVSLTLQAIKIPEEKSKTEVHIDGGPPFYKVPWFWSTLVFVALFMLLATRRAARG